MLNHGEKWLIIYWQGIDDINALLFALASPPDEIEVLAITPTYGNVDVKK